MQVQRRLFEMSGLGVRPNGENRPQAEVRKVGLAALYVG